MKIKEIYWVVVNKISLVKKGDRPAVESAENKYSIFKKEENQNKISKEDFEKLEKIQKQYQEILSK